MGDSNPQRTLSELFFVIPECLASICVLVLAFTVNKQTLLIIYIDLYKEEFKTVVSNFLMRVLLNSH